MPVVENVFSRECSMKQALHRRPTKLLNQSPPFEGLSIVCAGPARCWNRRGQWAALGPRKERIVRIRQALGSALRDGGAAARRQ